MLSAANYRRLGLLAVLVSAAVMLGGIKGLVDAFHVTHTYGRLTVTVSEPNATLSVSQAREQARVIGAGSDVTAWLPPGTYLLSASDKGLRSSAAVTVQKQQITPASIDMSAHDGLPSVQGVNFVNISALLNAGLTSGQVDRFKRQVFSFDTSARKVAITGQVVTGPLNSGSGFRFSDTFPLSIDDKAYSATLRYDNTISLQVVLVDQQTGAQVFNSSTAPGPAVITNEHGE